MKFEFDAKVFESLGITAEEANESFKRFAEQFPKRRLPQIIMNPVDTGKLRESMKVDDTPYRRLSGMPIIESSFVEVGKAYLIPQPIPVPPNFDMLDFEQKLRQEIFRSLGLPSRYFGIEGRVPNYNRLPDESIIDYGKRLAKLGVLDNPDIRWIYQKEVLTAVFVIPIQKLIEWAKHD